MYDGYVSHGCEHLGVRFMSDTVSSKMQEKINNKADEIFGDAQEKFEKYLNKLGYVWEMGVIKSTKLPSCYGEPLCDHNRAENGCYDCPFEKRCEAVRRSRNECDS